MTRADRGEALRQPGRPTRQATEVRAEAVDRAPARIGHLTLRVYDQLSYEADVLMWLAKRARGRTVAQFAISTRR